MSDMHFWKTLKNYKATQEAQTVREFSDEALEDQKRAEFWEKVLETAGDLVEMAELAVMLPRGKLRILEWAAIGLKTAHVGMKVYDTWTVSTMPSTEEISSVFSRERGWEGITKSTLTQWLGHSELRGTLSPDAPVQYNSDGTVGFGAWTVTLREATPTRQALRIGWTGNNPVVDDWGWTTDVQGLEDYVRSSMWTRAGKDKTFQVMPSGAGEPKELPGSLIETADIRSVHARAKKFWDAGMSRVYLLDGEPRSGKTTSCLRFVQAFDARAIVVDAWALVSPKAPHSVKGLFLGHWEAITFARPDVLIINDPDRLNKEQQVRLLSMLEDARSWARAVFVTTNDASKLLDAIRGPGRVDDLIESHGLSRAEVDAIMGTLGSEAVRQRLVGWPVMYVVDARDRLKILGDDAIAEIDILESRLLQVRAERGAGQAGQALAGAGAQNGSQGRRPLGVGSIDIHDYIDEDEDESDDYEEDED